MAFAFSSRESSTKRMPGTEKNRVDHQKNHGRNSETNLGVLCHHQPFDALRRQLSFFCRTANGFDL